MPQTLEQFVAWLNIKVIITKRLRYGKVLATRWESLSFIK